MIAFILLGIFYIAPMVFSLVMTILLYRAKLGDKEPTYVRVVVSFIPIANIVLSYHYSKLY